MVEAVRGSDLVLLVTEPTPFGAHDLRLALETVAMLGLPAVVVINRAGEGNELIYACSERMGVPVIGELPDDRGVAEAYACGLLAYEQVRGYGQRVRRILEQAARQGESPCVSWS